MLPQSIMTRQLQNSRPELSEDEEILPVPLNGWWEFCLLLFRPDRFFALPRATAGSVREHSYVRGVGGQQLNTQLEI